MKVRSDYVTNSSSSSFIIAKHKDCTFDEIKNSVNNQRDKIKNFLSEYIKYIHPENEEIKNQFLAGNEQKAVDLAVDEIAECLDCFTGEASVELGEWSAHSQEFGDEDSDLFKSAMYNFGCSFASEHMKIG